MRHEFRPGDIPVIGDDRRARAALLLAVWVAAMVLGLVVMWR